MLRCTTCREEFTREQASGRSSCPNCGTASLPMVIADDVEIRINWHELRILGIWASNYARRHGHGDSRKALATILHSIAMQHPERAASSPLTLAGEIGILRRAAESGDLTGEPTTIETNVRDLLDEDGFE